MHRVLLLAAVAACVLATQRTATAVAGDDASGVLAKHKAYVGWAYDDGTLKSARSTIVAEQPAATPRPGATPDPLGPVNRAVTIVRRELLYRTDESEYGVVVASEGFTGSVFWRANANAQTVTRRGDDAREALTEDVIEAEAFAEVPATVRPSAPFDDKAAAVVRIAPKTGATADVSFDPTTGAMLGYVMNPDDSDNRYTTHIAGYAEFAPGKRYVSAWRFGKSKTIHRVTKFEPNVDVSDAALHPPSPTPAWSFGDGTPARITVVRRIGMFLQGGRSVVVDVSVNGKRGRFLFDSGAGATIVYDPIGKDAGITDIGRSGYTGVSGRSVQAALARVDELRIGNATLKGVLVHHSTRMIEGLDGVLGFDVLADAVVQVDLVKNTMAIRDPNGFAMDVPAGGYAFNPNMSDFHAGVPVKVDDRILESVYLDTGDDYFLMLPPDVKKHAIAVPAFSGLMFSGADGEAEQPSPCGRLRNVQVGPYRYQDAIACFSNFDRNGGLIGFDFLRHFNWTFDYPHGKVVLAPNGE